MTVTINGAPHPLAEGCTLAALLADHGVPAKGVAVAVDGTVVPRASWPETTVADGATVEVLTAVQGG